MRLNSADSMTALGLDEGVRACLFDMDGVLTQTANVHAAAWKEMFDEYLRRRVASTGETFRPFDPVDDYDSFVDGRPRADGTRAFLKSRGIRLPEGEGTDPPEADTIQGLSLRKDGIFLHRVREEGVVPYEGSVRYVTAARGAGLRCAVVTASVHATEILRSAGIDDLFDAVVDGVVITAEGLRGKPAPDTFLAAAGRLHLGADSAAVFDDALSGVEAGRAGGFRLVVGVDRAGQAEALRHHGAHRVVGDLSELLVEP